jgi:hypothetical protein
MTRKRSLARVCYARCRTADPRKPRRDEEQQEQERERADSLTGGVFGLIKRMLSRRQPQPKPYVFRAFPKSSDW